MSESLERSVNSVNTLSRSISVFRLKEGRGGTGGHARCSLNGRIILIYDAIEVKEKRILIRFVLISSCKNLM